MAGDHNMHCSGNQCQGHAKQQQDLEGADLLARLREGFTNPIATPLEFAEAADEIESLRAEVRKWSDRYHSLWVTVMYPKDMEIFAMWAEEVNEMYRDEE